MASYDVSSLGSIAEAFTKGQEYLDSVTMVIEPEENNVDPLILLKAFQAERTLEEGLKLATAFVVGKRVGFMREKEVLLDFTPIVGKPLISYFASAPYLVDILVSTSWALLLKKLTPPSNVSTSAKPQ